MTQEIPNQTKKVDTPWYDKAVDFSTLWTGRLGLAVLAAAGLLHLLAGIDAVIAWPVTVVLVGLLTKEIL